MSKLTEKKCVPCEGGTKPLSITQAQKLLTQINEWEMDENASKIFRKFSFKDFYQTMAFVNAVAFIAHQENHHPGMEVGYNQCRLVYSTHAINGLSENDFICAAKVNALFS